MNAAQQGLPDQPDSVAGHVVDVVQGTVTPGVLHIIKGRIAQFEPRADVPQRYLIPGFIDAHIHVESTMLPPAEFARWAVVQGTVATVSDPHEIANVLGVAGVEYMIAEAARRPPFTILFGAPSCVPATAFETSGAVLDAEAVQQLLSRPEIGYLSEVMNVPGVLNDDPDLLAKLRAARRAGKPIDGHAPGFRGEAVMRYAAAGVSTDHECTTLEEARDRLAAGMWVLIREGSAAKDFDALAPLLFEAPEHLMFCSDDKHPNDLLVGHINSIAARAVALGADPIAVLRIACLNPARHYGIDTGLLRPGDRASFVVVDDLLQFRPLATYLDGTCAAREGQPLWSYLAPETPNVFRSCKLTPSSLRLSASRDATLRVIEAYDGKLITGERLFSNAKTGRDGTLQADTARDLLKIAVVNRYTEADPAVALVHGFGLKRGAIASSVAHDSHNVVAVGADDESLLAAIGAVVGVGGGVAVARSPQEVDCLELPIAGLMAAGRGDAVAARYEELDRAANALGSRLRSPLMTLSFMALPVIPRLKLSDKGLFDGEAFAFTTLEIAPDDEPALE